MHGGDEDDTDEAALIERLDALESLQRRISRTGEALVERLKTSASLAKAEQMEADLKAKDTRIGELEEELAEAMSQLDEATAQIQQLKADVDAVHAELKSAKDKSKNCLGD